MGLVLNRSRHLQKRRQLAARDAAPHRALERRQACMHASGHGTPPRRQRDHERPSILGTNLARDQAAIDETVEDARERRSLVSQAAVQRGNRRRRGARELPQDVRLALREIVLTQIGEVESDPMRRAVNRRNQPERHE